MRQDISSTSAYNTEAKRATVPRGKIVQSLALPISMRELSTSKLSQESTVLIDMFPYFAEYLEAKVGNIFKYAKTFIPDHLELFADQSP
jgi:hypothetical protein